ncbi:MoaD/ThiS family protein [Salinigranum marinum]|uniref:MoaD/ThiS family protein n=1 Tax=Salinigranum marinum TaxID=1515595 RepID=UPI002989B2B4|nr:MoaD/ThiS family protein [Salinigranum marinum]
MDVRVTLYGPLRGVTGTKTVDLAVEAGEREAGDTKTGDGDATPPTVDDVVRAFVERYPRSRGQLLTDDGPVRPSVRVLCDGERRPLTARVTGEVSLFPAMRGG